MRQSLTMREGAAAKLDMSFKSAITATTPAPEMSSFGGSFGSIGALMVSQ
jgi:hypothetical protein